MRLLSKTHGNCKDCVGRSVWLDIGAHLGESTFEFARVNPNLTVYAFEPSLKLAAKMFGALDNYIVIPMAVAESDGFSSFYVNRHDSTSSLLPFNQEALGNWIGGDELQIEKEVIVPTIRLDTFLNCMGITKVDFLKVDAQGGDFGVIASAGKRLRDVHKITLGVAITPLQLYLGAKEKSVVVSFLEQNGFVLVRAGRQSHDQEENLTFLRMPE